MKAPSETVILVVNASVPNQAPAAPGSHQPHWNWGQTISIVEKEAAPLGSHPVATITAGGIRQQTAGEHADSTAQQPHVAHQAHLHPSAADAEAVGGSAPQPGMTYISAC